MAQSAGSGLDQILFYGIGYVLLLFMVVAVSQWLRSRREREIYKKTQRDALKTVMTHRQRGITSS